MMMTILKDITSRLSAIEQGRISTNSPNDSKNSNFHHSITSDSGANSESRAKRVVQAAAKANNAVLGLPKAQFNMVEQFLESPNSSSTAPKQAIQRGIPPNLDDGDSDSDSNEPSPSILMNSSSTTSPPVDSTMLGKVSTTNQHYDPALFPPSASQSVILKPRQFHNIENMQSIFTTQLFKFMHQDAETGTDSTLSSSRTSPWVRYYNHILRLCFHRGFQYANEYHWRLFDKINSNEWDLQLQGHYNGEIQSELDIKYRDQSGACEVMKQLLYIKPGICFKHPAGTHSWANCSNNPKSAKSKQQQQNKGNGKSGKPWNKRSDDGDDADNKNKSAPKKSS
jgi:hypothetical protein